MNKFSPLTSPFERKTVNRHETLAEAKPAKIERISK